RRSTRRPGGNRPATARDAGWGSAPPGTLSSLALRRSSGDRQRPDVNRQAALACPPGASRLSVLMLSEGASGAACCGPERTGRWARVEVQHETPLGWPRFPTDVPERLPRRIVEGSLGIRAPALRACGDLARL